MRVKPPGESASPDARGIDGVGGGGVSDAAGVERAPALSNADLAQGVAPASPVERSGKMSGARNVGADPVAEVARRLRAGEITAQQALEQLIEDVVSRQVGAAAADRQALTGQLKDLLRRQAESDPYLASKVRRLGNRS